MRNVDSIPPVKPRPQIIECMASSGNVLVDLGLRNPESLKRKSKLMAQLIKEIRRLKLSPSEFALLMDLLLVQAARMRLGYFDVIAERRMKECLEKLRNEK